METVRHKPTNDWSLLVMNNFELGQSSFFINPLKGNDILVSTIFGVYSVTTDLKLFVTVLTQWKI